MERCLFDTTPNGRNKTLSKDIPGIAIVEIAVVGFEYDLFPVELRSHCEDVEGRDSVDGVVGRQRKGRHDCGLDSCAW